MICSYTDSSFKRIIVISSQCVIVHHQVVMRWAGVRSPNGRIWVNFTTEPCDLSLELMVRNRGIIPRWSYFRLVNYILANWPDEWCLVMINGISLRKSNVAIGNLLSTKVSSSENDRTKWWMFHRHIWVREGANDIQTCSLKLKIENWLVVWDIWIIFPFSWESHHPNWFIFFRGVGQPPTRKWID